tara:strand:+ start:3110 stop:4168 length:1059 start_codon:yes stop_codon:yes gene_type:complete
MANRDLLKEAIADAKAVKEVAIANAKAALEESFTPHLKTMLAQKINEMDELEETNLAEVDKEKKAMEEEKVEEGNEKIEEADDTLEEAEELEEELNLDEILAELELEEGEEVKEVEDQMEEAEKPEMEEAEDQMEEADVTYEAEDKLEAEEDIDLEDMSEEDLKGFIEGIIEDLIEDGELVPGPNADESEAEEDEDMDDGMEGDADVDIEVDDIDLEEAKEEKVDEEKEEMKEELKEAKSAIKQLRSDLNEINLLNSKLLYTNKIFKGKSLTENQKIKVLKAFDKAETVKEAKAIFETLNENLVTKTKKSHIRESLGAASKPAGVAPKRNLNEGIIQEDAMVSRFKQLAGIK